MTNERIIEGIMAAAACLSADDKQAFDDALARLNSGEWSGRKLFTAPAILAGMVYEARRDVADAAAKKSGKPNYRKALERVYTNATRDNLQGAWLDSAGRVCVCDGCRAIRLNDADALELGGLAMLDTTNGEPLDLSSLFDCESGGDALDLPTLGELNAFIKTSRAEYAAEHGGKKPRSIIYRFSDGVTYVNAAYLLDILTAFGDNAEGMTCTTRTKTVVSEHGVVCNINSILFRCAAGDALLCPARSERGAVGGVAL